MMLTRELAVKGRVLSTCHYFENGLLFAQLPPLNELL